ncbi:MAG TPA: hypothetical protein VGB18_01860 [Candidatus Thermoplasmatota archaeon]
MMDVPAFFAASMTNKQVSATLGADEYKALLRASQKLGLNTAEAIREATLAWVRATFSDSDGIVSVLGKAESTRVSNAPAPAPVRVPHERPEFLRPPQRPL